MLTLKRNNNWLRHRVDEKIRAKYGHLLITKMSLLRKCIDYSSGKDKWWIVVLLIGAMFFFMPYLDIKTLDFIKIDSNTSRTIVDQRTTNLATIISITLVVIGFLINNIAVKSSLTYRLLFQKSYLYPIIYSTLSTIGFFVVASTLRDSIPNFQFSRIVIVGSYLVLVILFLIGFLFRTIIQFTDEKKIWEMLDHALMSEVKRSAHQVLIKRVSKEVYNEFMQSIGVKKYDPLDYIALEAVEVEESHEEVDRTRLIDRVIENIHLTGIATHIKKTNIEHHYTELYLGQEVDKADIFLWKKGDRNFYSKISKYYFLSRKPAPEKDTSMLRKYYEQRLQTFAEEGDYKKLPEVLNSYLKLYELQMNIEK